MSITRAQMRAILDGMTDRPHKGVTDTAGDENKKTLQDTKLAGYPDRWFKDRFVYLPTTEEERLIVAYHAPEGIVQVGAPFASQVALGTEYEIHSIPVALKNDALNDSLNEAFPRFYKRVVDTSLTGKGSSDNLYEVPTGFEEPPGQIWLRRISGNQHYETLADADFFRDSDGKLKFIASIATTYSIRLVGRAHLTPFTNDASTTELTHPQALVVCYKAAALLYGRLVDQHGGAEDAKRYKMLQQEKEVYYELHSRREGMPNLRRRSLSFGA